MNALLSKKQRIKSFAFKILISRLLLNSIHYNYSSRQCQDVYPELMEDLQKLVASPMVTENEFPSTFLKALSTSGVETK